MDESDSRGLMIRATVLHSVISRSMYCGRRCGGGDDSGGDRPRDPEVKNQESRVESPEVQRVEGLHDGLQCAVKGCKNGWSLVGSVASMTASVSRHLTKSWNNNTRFLGK